MVHGKQIKDTSLALAKINPGTGQLLTLVGTTKIQQAAVPTTDTDLTNKAYVDALVTGLDFKQSVRVTTPGVNIDLASAPAAIDGVTLTSGDRVLIKDQTLPEENGIYVFNGTGNAMTRSTDADGTSANEVSAGMFCFVTEGTSPYADTGWVLSTNDPIVLGTTGLIFIQFSQAGVITAINGLTKTGSQIKLGGTLTENTIITGATGTYNLELGTTGDKLQNFEVNTNSNLFLKNTNGTNDSAVQINNTKVEAYFSATGAAYANMVLNNTTAELSYQGASSDNYVRVLDGSTRMRYNDGAGVISENILQNSGMQLTWQNGTQTTQVLGDSTRSEINFQDTGLTSSSNYSGTGISHYFTNSTVITQNDLTSTGNISIFNNGAGIVVTDTLNATENSDTWTNGTVISNNVLNLTKNESKFTDGTVTSNSNLTASFIELSIADATAASSVNLTLTDAVLATSDGLGITSQITNNLTDSTASYTDGTTTSKSSLTADEATLLYTDGTIESGAWLGLGQAQLYASTGLNTSDINIYTTPIAVTNNGSDNNMIITDSISSKGLVYNADYTANFTPESLVTKRYVDANASAPVTTDKGLAASTTTASGQQIAAAIAATPVNDSYVQVFINGVKATVGSGVNTAEVYFADAGDLATPKTIANITAGDVLVRGTALGYDTDSSDVVEYDYSV